MDRSHVAVIVTFIVSALLIVSVAMPWAYYEKGQVHIRYSATEARVCILGRHCTDVQWKDIHSIKSRLRDIAEIAYGVTSDDAVVRNETVYPEIGHVKLPSKPVDIVYLIVPASIPFSATSMPIRWKAVRCSLVGFSALLIFTSVVISLAQISHFSQRIGAGAGVAIASMIVACMRAVAEVFI